MSAASSIAESIAETIDIAKVARDVASKNGLGNVIPQVIAGACVVHAARLETDAINRLIGTCDELLIAMRTK